MIQKDPPIQLLYCDHCRGSSASRMPKQEVLDEYYSAYYDEADRSRVTCHNVPQFAKHILRYIPRPLPQDRKPLRILDFGGGDGSVSVEIAQFLQTPVVATVIDYSELTKRQLNNLDLRKVEGLSAVDEPQDIVIASAVLEHVPELHAVVKGLFGLVSPGGYFYARTPYILPFMKLLNGYFDFTFPAHVHDLGPYFWGRIAETFALNAEIISSRPSFVETVFRQALVRTTVAYILKLPALIQVKLTRGSRNKLIWPYVGGWEIVLQRHQG